MNTTFGAYLEFICADQATQSELWKQSIEALTKNPRTKFAPKQKPVYAEGMSTEQKRIPGTFEPGDHVRLRYSTDVEGVVIEDYRKEGGNSVEIIFDGHRDSFSCTPEAILSTEVGK